MNDGNRNGFNVGHGNGDRGGDWDGVGNGFNVGNGNGDGGGDQDGVGPVLGNVMVMVGNGRFWFSVGVGNRW